MSLKDIVNVTITRETKAVSKVGFGTAMILGIHKRFNERIKYYSNLSSVLDDFVSTDLEYIVAAPLFSQENAVVRIAIGRRKTNDTAVITVSDVQNLTKYETTINGTVFDYTSNTDATDLEIAAGLVAAINLGSEPVTATDNVDGTYDLDPDVADVPYTVAVDSRQTIAAYTTPDAVADDLNAVKNESNDWYGVVYTKRVKVDQLAAAAWAEANEKFASFSSDEVDIIDVTAASDTASLPAQLKAAAYVRSHAIYHPDAVTYYPESALFGNILPRNPGTYTAMFKTLAGISVTVLSDTQSKNARDKNCMVYEEIGGVNITREGKTAEGEYIDVIIFIDWLKADITTNVYGKFVNLPKVPFTDAGIAVVEAEVKRSLNLGIDRQGIAQDPPYIVTVPLAANVSPTDKANRLFPDVEFEATLAGAIHATTINGRVVL